MYVGCRITGSKGEIGGHVGSPCVHRVGRPASRDFSTARFLGSQRIVPLLTCSCWRGLKSTQALVTVRTAEHGFRFWGWQTHSLLRFILEQGHVHFRPSLQLWSWGGPIRSETSLCWLTVCDRTLCMVSLCLMHLLQEWSHRPRDLKQEIERGENLPPRTELGWTLIWLGIKLDPFWCLLVTNLNCTLDWGAETKEAGVSWGQEPDSHGGTSSVCVFSGEQLVLRPVHFGFNG